MDFNNDNITDLIVGERDGYVNFFQRNSDGILLEKVRLQANDTDIKVTNNSSPVITDWNSDGLLDLLVDSDEQADGVRLYLNSGTVDEYKFTDFSKLKYGSVEIAFKRSQIRVYDLNNDGKKDLLLGTGLTAQTRIYYFENSGTAENPILKFPTQLKTETGNPIYPPFTQYDIAFDINDWNGDGSPDIVMGDYDALAIHLFLSDPPVSSDFNLAQNTSKNSIYIKEFTSNNISLNIKNSGKYSIEVVNALGKVLFKTSTMFPKGINNLKLGNSRLCKGVYLIKISGEKSFSFKTIISN